MFRDAGLSPEEIDEYASRGVKDFENNAKRAFRDVVVDQSIEIAGTRYNNTKIRARRGRITLPGYVKHFDFEHMRPEICDSLAGYSGLP
jgi:hypothetical protein